MDIRLSSHRMRLHFELGIAERAHFRHIQTCQFRSGTDALTDEHVDDPVDDEAEGEYETDQRRDADQLRHQLAGIAVEQPGDDPVTPFHEPP